MKALARLLALAAAFGWFSSTSAPAADRKPNFLFIYTDDQRWDALGVVQREQGERARFPWFQTPHLDRLAAEGMRFRNAFVTLSLCAPSRAAFLTGRYNHHNGVVNNHTPFPTNSVTHATLLQAAGYRTAYIGKWHHGQQRGQRPGFDYSASFVGQGRYFDCALEINGKPTPTTGWVDDVTTDYAIAFMKAHRAKPFSIVVGFKATHGPWTPPDRAKDRFAGENARPVPNLEVQPIYRNEDSRPSAPKKSGSSASNINLNYFRCLSAMDDNVGRLVETLNELGLADDTVVVFTSDNGFYHREHGLSDKRSAYDESLRIPLLVRYPRLVSPGKISDALVLNIDLAPTYLELAGLPVLGEMQGRSWRPLLAGQPTAWRQAFLAEYFFEQNFPGTPTLVAVRTHDAKLIRYPGHEEWTELFDLSRDPYETKNLAADPQSKPLRERMQSEFDRQVKATGYHIPAHADKPGATNTPSAGRKQKPGKAKKAAVETD